MPELLRTISSRTARHEPRGSPRRLHAVVRCGIVLRLLVRHNNVLKHGKMFPVERHERNLQLGRRRSDEGVRQPHIVTFAVVSAIETTLDRQAQVEWDGFKGPKELLQTCSFLAFPPAYNSATVTTEMRSRSCCAST